MARGGYRPGAGRKPGQIKDDPSKAANETIDQAKKALSYDLKAKASMYQDFLVKISKGQKLTLAEKKTMVKLSASLEGSVRGDDGKKPDNSQRKDPLTFLLDIMNDVSADPDLRFRAAVSAAPFCHSRKAEGGGKQQAKDENAAAASVGRFAPSRPPTLKAVK